MKEVKAKAQESRQLWRKTAAVASAAALALVGAGKVSAESSGAQHLSDSCRQKFLVDSHKKPDWQKYRLCAEYLLNVGYRENGIDEPLSGGEIYWYTYATSPDLFMQRFSKNLLEQSHWSYALKSFENRTVNWPTGTFFVDNEVSVNSVYLNMKKKLAVIGSTQSWTVTNPTATAETERIVYQEIAQPHTVTMCQVPVEGGTAWIEVAEDSELDYPCDGTLVQVGTGQIG